MKIKIKLNDDSIKEFDNPTSIINIAKSISSTLAKKTMYGIIDNINYNNNYIVKKNIKLNLATINNFSEKLINEQSLKMILLIIKNNIKDIQIINSSFNEDYFYIDFDIKEPFKEKDLTLFTNKIKKFVKYFKLNESFIIDNIKFISNFKFVQISGTYLEGKKNNKMINRITGIASPTIELLNLKELKLQERMKLDHRYIGSKMKLFTFSSEVGQGLPIWLPNGTILKNEIKKFLKQKDLEYDFLEVNTPVLGSSNMYKISGHLNHYSDDMFPLIKKHGEELMLRPMTCPHHIEVFKSISFSYRDLPLRFSENSYLFRYEKSGALTGLERVRMMELTDSHIFTDIDNLKNEFKICFKSIIEVLNTFKIKIYYFSLSLRDKNNKKKFYDDDLMWNNTEKILKEVLDELKINYKIVIGEAAFYGPKLDIQIESVLKHEITISTIQLDMLGTKKFNATYIDKTGKKQYPVMIHRGLIGTFERFISILLEQTKGILPLWLSPLQIMIIPVNNNFIKYCDEIKTLFQKNNIRINIDKSNERLSYKIRNAQINKIPYQLIIGENEQKTKTITVRKYSSEELQTLPINKFLKSIQKIINEKTS